MQFTSITHDESLDDLVARTYDLGAAPSKALLRPCAGGADPGEPVPPEPRRRARRHHGGDPGSAQGGRQR